MAWMTTPAIEGWFASDPEPHLIGTRCSFPPERTFCRNPGCSGETLNDTPLSRRGKVWSYTVNHYAAPPPAVVEAPYGVAAVELGEEKMIVLGLVTGDPDALNVGDEVEVVVEPLDAEKSVWKWRKM
jgi:uncharacterized OB-fold protein